MSDATLEKIISDIRSLSPAQQETLRRLLNGSPIVIGQVPEPPFVPRIISTNAPIKDRTKENEWLRQHRDEYAGQWVALDGDQLLGHSSRFEDVAQAAEEAGVPDALIFIVEGSQTPPFAGF